MERTALMELFVKCMNWEKHLQFLNAKRLAYDDVSILK